MNYLYKGWIPTVSGRLSFQSFGKTNYPVACNFISTLIKDEDQPDSKHLLYILQKRHRTDTILPFETSFDIAKGGSPQIYFFEGVYEESSKSELIGKVIFFDTPKAFHEFKKFTKDNNSLYKENSDYRIFNYFENHQKKLDENNLYPNLIVDVSINRNGITEISTDDDHLLKRIKNDKKYKTAVQTALNDFDASDEILAYHELEKYVSQIFFFLKDIAHRHQHHDPDNDRLTAIYSLVKNKDDYSWALKNAKALMRQIINDKRKADEKSARRANGLIAYLDSFLSALDLKNENNEAKPTVKEELNAIHNSIKNRNLISSISSYELSEVEIRRKNSLLQVNLALFFGFFALLLQMMEVYNDDSKGNISLYDIVAD